MESLDIANVNPSTALCAYQAIFRQGKWQFLTSYVRCDQMFRWTSSCSAVSSFLSLILVITRDSEGIMFSRCVFVCVCVYICHDVCPDDLTMKDWCHTNNILQVYSWGSLIVKVMFHALMTSSMKSAGHKVGQILKLLYLHQYFS